MDKAELTRQWFRYAKDDLESAIILFEHRNKPVEIICYLCQQSVEKDLKGFLIHNEADFPKIHDLPKLNLLCEEINFEFNKIKDECLNLTSYGVELKYPIERNISDSGIKKAIEDARTVKNFVKDRLK